MLVTHPNRFASSSMPLSALFNGKPTYSPLCTDEEWEAVRHASKQKLGTVSMRCCITPAIPKVLERTGTRFFQHKGKRPGNCQWQPVSEEHQALQTTAAQAIQAREGWKAGIEEAEGGWRADVLAERGRLRIAFEIQLSPQSVSATTDRNTRFLNCSVVPVWLKGKRNHNNDFGGGLQRRIEGDSLREQADSVCAIVVDILAAIERQIAVARAVRDAVSESNGWRYKIDKLGEIPVSFTLSRQGHMQTILLSELGAQSLPSIQRHAAREINAREYAGAVIHLRVQSAVLRGYGCSGFAIDGRDPLGSARRILHPIMRGERCWRGREHEETLPGSFVHYPDECRHCGTRFLRITHALIGNPRFPVQMPPRIDGGDFAMIDVLTPDAERLATRLNLPLGSFTSTTATYFQNAGSFSQSCPECNCYAPPSLITDEEAATWPHREEHFRVRLSMPGKGWMSALQWQEQPAGDIERWKAMLAGKLNKRAEEIEAETRQREEERQRCAAETDKWRRKQAEDRAREEAERKSREEAWELEQANRAGAKRERESAKRQGVLICAAERLVRDPLRRSVWLHSTNPRTGGRHPVTFAAESEANLETAIHVLAEAARHL